MPCAAPTGIQDAETPACTGLELAPTARESGGSRTAPCRGQRSRASRASMGVRLHCMSIEGGGGAVRETVAHPWLFWRKRCPSSGVDRIQMPR